VLNGEECCGSGAHSMKGPSGNQAICTIHYSNLNDALAPMSKGRFPATDAS
jgi:hypothetical protein